MKYALIVRRGLPDNRQRRKRPSLCGLQPPVAPQLKRALPWEALCEVMTHHWRRAGNITMAVLACRGMWGCMPSIVLIVKRLHAALWKRTWPRMLWRGCSLGVRTICGRG